MIICDSGNRRKTASQISTPVERQNPQVLFRENQPVSCVLYKCCNLFARINACNYRQLIWKSFVGQKSALQSEKHIMSNKISFVTVDQTNNPHLLSDFNYEDFLRKPIEGEQSVYELSQKTILTQQEDKVLQHFRSAYHLHVHVGLRQHLPCNCVDEICWHNTVEQTLIVALPSYFSLDAVQEDGTFFDERLKSDIFSNYNCRFVGKMQVVNRPCVKKEMLKFLSKI